MNRRNTDDTGIRIRVIDNNTRIIVPRNIPRNIPRDISRNIPRDIPRDISRIIIPLNMIMPDILSPNNILRNENIRNTRTRSNSRTRSNTGSSSRSSTGSNSSGTTQIYGDRNTCSICFERLTSKNRRVLGCSHAFHTKCINDYCSRVSNCKCPICRARITN